MGRFRVTGTARARLLMVSGGLVGSAGVGWELGAGWGAVVGGALAVVYGLLVVDVDDDKAKRGGRG